MTDAPVVKIIKFNTGDRKGKVPKLIVYDRHIIVKKKISEELALHEYPILKSCLMFMFCRRRVDSMISLEEQTVFIHIALKYLCVNNHYRKK